MRPPYPLRLSDPPPTLPKRPPYPPPTTARLAASSPVALDQPRPKGGGNSEGHWRRGERGGSEDEGAEGGSVGRTPKEVGGEGARVGGVEGVGNLSFSGLSGDISSSFISLKAVKNLDLSHNNFTGSIPDALSQLPSLTYLDLSYNQLTGSIPPGLLKRVQDGSLNLRYNNNPGLCSNGYSCQTAKGKSKLYIYILIPVVLLAVIDYWQH
ncbi:hypothetical protein PR202_ga05708 [Eleusine coracana subsp. coracana]|uniref:Uncharacterized protein n=1 Tax=Eleusine coracana subsp. coracana TaxID=191504 RepID=A0AAV5BU54_ELECO|nr:hypothetical protein PR202_ga05708 [Eleusine coracana subsp. coracana]